MNGSPLVISPPALVDQYGNPFPANDDPAFQPPHDPLKEATRATAVPVYRDIPVLIAAGNPGSPEGSAWTITELRNALTQHQLGYFQSSGVLCDSVLGDDRVQATLGSRTAGLFGRDVTHERARLDEDGACYSAWVKNWPRIAPQSVLAEVMRWGVMMGFALVEILWDTSDDAWVPVLKPWHPQNVYFRWDLRKYFALSIDGPIEVEPGNGKWMLFTPHGSYRGWMHGAIRATAQPWFLRQLAFRDWARYSERHGLPIIKAQVPAGGDAIQKQRWIQSLGKLGPETAMILPQMPDGTSYDLSMLEAKDRSWEAFKGLIEQCDKSLIMPILWQNLTTEVKEGSFAAARVHGDVRQSALEFDNSTLSECLYEQLARPFAFFNFGDARLAVRDEWDVTPPEDYDMMAKSFQALATAVRDLAQGGYAIEPTALEGLLRVFGIRIPEGSIEKAPPVKTGLGA